ncbi:MAG: hypothetical protein C5B49_10810 [Bdellovibrio sp.]|nr:MAG: hypothetical protein C5B49_10810 [Bdellovibrio sp.]
MGGGAATGMELLMLKTPLQNFRPIALAFIIAMVTFSSGELIANDSDSAVPNESARALVNVQVLEPEGSRANSDSTHKATQDAERLAEFLWSEAKIHARVALVEVPKRALLELGPQQVTFSMILTLATFSQLAAYLQEDPNAIEAAMIDPWGASAILGFYTLMATQGYTAFTVDRYLANQTLRSIMPQTLGLAIGMGAMTYVGAVLQDPSVKLCAHMTTIAFDSGTESLGAEERSREIVERRRRLYDEYGLPATASPCDEAYNTLFGEDTTKKVVASGLSATITSLLIHQVSGNLLRFGGQSLIELSGAPGALGGDVGLIMFLRGMASRETGRIALTFGCALKGLEFLTTRMSVFSIPLFIAVHQDVMDVRLTPVFRGLVFEGRQVYREAENLDRAIRAQRLVGWNLRAETTSDQLNSECLEQYQKEAQPASVGGAAQVGAVGASSSDATGLNLAGSMAKATKETACSPLNYTLTKLGRLFSSWRSEKILYQIKKEQSAWQAALQAFNSEQEAAKKLYLSLVNEIEKTRRAPGARSLLDDQFGTFGVRAPDKGKTLAQYLLDPENYKRNQIEYISRVVKVAREEWIPEHKTRYWSPDSKNKALRILDQLDGSNNSLRFQALQWLYAANESHLPTSKELRQFESADPYLRDFWARLWNELGRPEPLVEPGRGFPRVIAEIPENRPAFFAADKALQPWVARNYFGLFVESLSDWGSIDNDLKQDDWIAGYVPLLQGSLTRDVLTPFFDHFRKGTFLKYRQTHVVDKYLLQMVCGPRADAWQDEPVAGWHEGHRARFVPPAIVKDPQFMREHFCIKGADEESLESGRLYSDPITGRDGSQYSGIMNYILNNVRDDVATGEGFLKWWNKQVEPQVTLVYKRYRIHYDNIVADAWSSIYNPGEKSLFSSIRLQEELPDYWETASNEVLGSYEQQAKMALGILQDIYAAGLGARTNDVLNTELASQDSENPPAPAEEHSPVFLASLKTGDSMSLDRFFGPASAPPRKAGRDFKFAVEILRDLRKLMDISKMIHRESVVVEGIEHHLLRADYSESDFDQVSDQLSRKIRSVLLRRFVVTAAAPQAAAAAAPPAAASSQVWTQKKPPFPTVAIRDPTLAQTVILLTNQLLQIVSEIQGHAVMFSLAAMKV